MRTRIILVTLSLPLLCACAFAAEPPAAAQLPDWSGTWEIIVQPFGRVPAAAGSAAPVRRTPYAGLKLPWTPKGQQKFDAIAAIAAAGGDVPSHAYQCIPGGMPMVMAGVEARFEFLFTHRRVTVLATPNNETRRIYTDGRAQQADPDLSFDGSSVGHWEGQTLVVHTVGLDPRNEIIYGIPGGKDIRVTERMLLKGPDLLEIDTVVEAPEMLAQPYRYTKTYRRTRNDMQEAYCAQNNRDFDRTTGGQGVNLTPPEPQ
jgi:hypothetical protein